MRCICDQWEYVFALPQIARLTSRAPAPCAAHRRSFDPQSGLQLHPCLPRVLASAVITLSDSGGEHDDVAQSILIVAVPPAPHKHADPNSVLDGTYTQGRHGGELRCMPATGKEQLFAVQVRALLQQGAPGVGLEAAQTGGVRQKCRSAA